MREIRTKGSWIVSALLLFVVFGSGCLFSTPEKDEGQTPYVYLDYTTVENLVDNFQAAWQKRNIQEYREKILFSNTWATPVDENDYQEFEFYFLDPDAPGIPGESWLYGDEIESVEGMFLGNPGENPNGDVIPGVRDIELTLTQSFPWTDWNGGSAGEVLGDPCPAGTKYALFDTDMLVTLKGNIGETDINGFQVNGRLQFYAIPVKGPAEGDPDEYRIWKWVDLQAR